MDNCQIGQQLDKINNLYTIDLIKHKNGKLFQIKQINKTNIVLFELSINCYKEKIINNYEYKNYIVYRSKNK